MHELVEHHNYIYISSMHSRDLLPVVFIYILKDVHCQQSNKNNYNKNKPRLK